MIDICDVGSRHPKISGGGLNGSYIFHQLHFHWSDDDSRGSEHTKSGTSFPLEVQLIHYKEEFGSIQQAREEPDGLAILSILFQVLIQTNYYWLLGAERALRDQQLYSKSWVLMQYYFQDVVYPLQPLQPRSTLEVWTTVLIYVLYIF
jgi:hypothetical protein